MSRGPTIGPLAIEACLALATAGCQMAPVSYHCGDKDLESACHKADGRCQLDWMNKQGLHLEGKGAGAAGAIALDPTAGGIIAELAAIGAISNLAKREEAFIQTCMASKGHQQVLETAGETSVRADDQRAIQPLGPPQTSAVRRDQAHGQPCTSCFGVAA